MSPPLMPTPMEFRVVGFRGDDEKLSGCELSSSSSSSSSLPPLAVTLDLAMFATVCSTSLMHSSLNSTISPQIFMRLCFKNGRHWKPPKEKANSADFARLSSDEMLLLKPSLTSFMSKIPHVLPPPPSNPLQPNPKHSALKAIAPASPVMPSLHNVLISLNTFLTLPSLTTLPSFLKISNTALLAYRMQSLYPAMPNLNLALSSSSSTILSGISSLSTHLSPSEDLLPMPVPPKWTEASAPLYLCW
mmetsp:Transcript_20325/g.42573  ORF Transcript_20325/g.42573 Transcript_20325/m.42573 type:complete len:246 (-) Transcript_20325:4687-5424(-)